jgi:hypothetical protein
MTYSVPAKTLLLNKGITPEKKTFNVRKEIIDWSEHL